MDDRSFESFVKAFATSRNRRGLLKGLLGLGGAVVTGRIVLDDAGAARRPTPTPSLPRCPGNQIPSNGACICPSGLSKCGPACCNPTGIAAAHSECCDNACCNGVCYGEELCCPYPRDFCLITGECCSSGVDCCADEGCCPGGACVTSLGAERCCPTDQYCPADVRSADLCCPAGWLCCGSGTAGRLCVDPAAGGCCQDSDCPDMGTACGACIANQCAASPCPECQACSNGTCVGCDAAGYGCCNNGACVECCDRFDCGPYHDCYQNSCQTCEEAGYIRCGEPPCDGTYSDNCCCRDCREVGCDPGLTCGSDGLCISCAEAGLLLCDDGQCGECCDRFDCGPYYDCYQHACQTCEEAGYIRCGEPPCTDTYSGNCCCRDCRQNGCDPGQVCGSDGLCISCQQAGLLLCPDGQCGACCDRFDCGPYHDCYQHACQTCEQAGYVSCGVPPCTGTYSDNCCCLP
jgi:hypothetical protein